MVATAEVRIGAALDGSFNATVGAATTRLRGIGDGITQSMQRGTQAVNQWARATQSGFGASMQSVQNQRAEYRGQLLDVAAVGAAMYGLMAPAVEFEAKMTDVGKVMPDGTDIDALGESLKAMSKEIPIALDGLVDIAAAGARVGITDPDQLIEYTAMVGKMAMAWDMGAEQAGEGIAKIGNTLQMTMEQQRLFGDALNSLDDSSTAKAPELIDMMLRLGTAGKDINLTAEQTAAFATTMVDLGNTAETGSTSLMNLFQVLKNAPNLRGPDAREALIDGLGLDPEALQAAMFEDGVAGIEMFSEALAKLDDAGRTKVMADIFGVGAVDANAMKLLMNMNMVRENLALVADEQNYAGSVQAEYEKKTDTAAAAIQRMGSTALVTAIAIGDSLTPAIHLVGAALGPVLDGVTFLAQEFPLVTQAIFGTVGALIALKAGSVVGGYAFTFLKEGALIAQLAGANIVTALGGIVTGIRAASVAMLMNPIGLTIAGIALAVGAAAIVIRKYWEPIAAFFQGVWAGVEQAFGPVAEMVSTALEPFNAVGEALRPIWEPIGTFLQDAAGWFTSLLEPVQLTTAEFNSATASGTKLGQFLGEGLAGFVDLALTPLELLGAAIKLVTGDFEGAKEGFANAMSGIVAVAGQYYTVGTAIVTAIWNGLQDGWGAVQSWFGAQIQGMINVIPGPLRDMMGLTAVVGGINVDAARKAADERAWSQFGHDQNTLGFQSSSGEQEAARKAAADRAYFGAIDSAALTNDVNSGAIPPEVAAQFSAGADTINAAMGQAVNLEMARAQALANEKPRSISVEVTAPITVNNTGGGDVSGQVANGVSQGANDILQAEQDAYVDG